MTLYESIKVIALKNVLKPNEEYYLRKVYRWYSKTFHTPLDQCFDIPLETVLTCFYEERFEGMDEEELQEELQNSIETEESRKAREETEEQDKISEYELIKMSETANPNSVPEAVKQLNETLNLISNDLKSMQSDPLDIDINFETDENFQKLIEKESNS